MSTAQLLNIVRVLSVRSQTDELAQMETWAAKEVDGYEDGDELPEHRVWQLKSGQPYTTRCKVSRQMYYCRPQYG